MIEAPSNGALGGPTQETAGQMLRKAREAAALDVAALAVAIKIPVKKLEALEADRFDLLHDVVFVRALASSVCRTLKMDCAPVLARLPQSVEPKLKEDQRGINAPFRQSRESVWSDWSSWLRNPYGLGFVVLLLATASLYWAPRLELGSWTQALSSPSDGNAAVQEQTRDVSVAVYNPNTSPQAEREISLETRTKAPVAAAALAATPLAPLAKASQEVVSSGEPVAVQLVPLVGVGAMASSVPLLELTARAESWVQVVDGVGVTQLSRVLYPGERVPVGGRIPLTVVVGKADVTGVRIRGNEFDHLVFARDNVARFEVR